MNRRVAAVAVLAAATVLTVASAANAREAQGPPPGIHDALRFELLSGPAQYVSGGATRVRVVVPASVPLSAATVKLSGADVTSSFEPDDQAPHAIEGVLTGLPLGASTIEARVPGPGNSASDRTALTLQNARQSFAARGRMLEHGDASNQVIWFTDARPARVFDQTPMALAVMDKWLENMRAHPGLGVAGNKPADAVDRCFATDGKPIYAGPDAWNGILNGGPTGPCAALFPIHGTSRTVAGGPFDEELYKCKLQPVTVAINRGLYGSWQASDTEVDRLRQIFPTGVCDYPKGSPPGFH